MTKQEFERVVDELVKTSRLGLISDIDGTLSPLAERPQDARVSPACVEALSILSGKLPLVALVTGRAVLDAHRMVNLPNVIYIGNHGLEEWRDGASIILPQAARFAHRIPDAMRRIQSQTNIDGLVFENKGVTGSIHYRMADDPEAARNQILDAVQPLAEIFDFRITEGQMVIEIRPPVDVNKGSAVERLATSNKLTGIIYLGNDLTDVDAFRAVQRLRESNVPGLAIGVIEKETDPAVTENSDWQFHKVDDVIEFLSSLIQKL
jgi:trehalose 6-phosphate phosphatase